ncbi:MAG: sigma-54-dependent Fis family transcriptional regulator [Planctomycetota bacterium]|nr:MAG: sigma-54-dependent Fis family transcriptional regulator [Planctomycetota bacterium]
MRANFVRVPAADLYRRLFALSCEQDLDSVLRRILDLVLEETGAERGFLVTPGPGGDLLVRAARGLDGAAVGGPGMRPSRTVVRRAIAAAAPVRIQRAQDASELAEQTSIAESSLQSILAVPVLEGGEVVAVVCADSRRPNAFPPGLEASIAALSQPLGAALRNARVVSTLRQHNRALADRLAARDGPAILGECPAMLATLDLLRRAAPTRASVLLLGETGTGKELLARELHRAGRRAAGPFVTVNCAALPDDLIEAELFGHVAGAFTGATQDRAGLFREAHGGTVFLDEVGELGPRAQSRFLRVLETGEIQRVGSDRSERVDVRVVAATHRNLLDPELGFRQDLFYRLAALTVTVPPLRERGNDVLLLAEAFCQQAAMELGRSIEGLGEEARQLVLKHSWPGNVRELRNAMHHGVVFCTGRRITPADLPEDVRSGAAACAGKAFFVRRAPASWDELQVLKKEAGLDLERAWAEEVLRRTRGNISAAARAAGLSRAAFYGLLERVSLRPEDFRSRRPPSP